MDSGAALMVGALFLPSASHSAASYAAQRAASFIVKSAAEQTEEQVRWTDKNFRYSGDDRACVAKKGDYWDNREYGLSEMKVMIKQTI